jgi:hypothetical protein
MELSVAANGSAGAGTTGRHYTSTDVWKTKQKCPEIQIVGLKEMTDLRVSEVKVQTD